MIQIYVATSTSENLRSVIELGNITATSSDLVLPLFFTHSHTSELENVGFYITPYYGHGYIGVHGESQDYLRILDWGTSSGKGIRLNQTTNTASASDSSCYFNGTSGVGHSISTPISLLPTAVLGWTGTETGIFPAGSTAKVVLKLGIPATETAVGSLMFGLFMTFDA